MTKRITAFVLCLLGTAVLGYGQVSTGSLAGTIRDPDGAAVPDAKVVVRQTETGAEQTTRSSDAGIYVFPALQTGVYTLTVEKTGFKRLSQTNIEIRIAARLDMDLRLEVGDVQQTIDVTAEAPVLETTSAQRGQGISPQFMNNLPLFTGGIRNAGAFVSYMPGVNDAVGERSIAGSGGRGSEVLIDGASLTIPESGGTVFNFPSAEIFSEMRVLTGSYDAEYGRFGGGVQIFVSKSGTNDLHGAGFWYIRRDIFNANSWANNARGVDRAKERYNEIGGSGGGPVYIPKLYDGRNKTFWYATYSKDKRPATASNTLSTVPTALMKQGNFSQVPQLIYDPLSTSGNTRTPFAGNIIPQERFSTISRNIIGAIPDPTRSSLTNNYDFINTNAYDRYIWSLKFDHAITANNRVSFLVTKENELSDQTTSFPGPLGVGLSNFQKPDNWRVNHDLVITPTVLLHSTFGYSRTRQIWDNPNQKGYASRFGFPGITGDSDATPRIMFTGADNLTNWGVQDGKVGNGSQINITYQFAQGLTWVKGKHEFKMGWDFRRLQTTSDPVDLAGTNGQYYFARAQTALPTNLSGTGHAFASLLLGLPDRANRVATPVLVGNIRYGYHAVYFNDNFKVTPNLTVNLGLRYDVPINWHEENGDYSAMDPRLANEAAGNLPGAMVFFGNGPGRTGQKRPYPTDWSNIGPRLGLTYRLLDKTVIRLGYGIFYQTLGNGGCGCRIGFANPISRNSDGLNGALQWDGGIAPPAGFRPPPLIDPTVGILNDVDVLSANFGKAPRVQNWSFNIQHEVKQFLFDVAYVGNQGTKLASSLDWNQLSTDKLALGSLLQKSITDPAVVAAGYTLPYPGFTGTLAQALRPYPQYLNVVERNAGIGRTWYHSLQTRVERRFGNFQMMASYVWSKSLALGHYRQIFTQSQVFPQDAYNWQNEKSYLPFDLPHVVNILTSYNLPFGRGKKFINTSNVFLNLLVADWTISGIQQYKSGALIQVTVPNTLGTGVLFSRVKRANVTLQPIQTGVDRSTLDPNNPSVRWFNASAFTIPGQYELGNSSPYYNDFRQPPVLNENFSLVKHLKFPVSADRFIDATLRADAFNLFNRTSFGGVNGTIGSVDFGRPSGAQVGARLITMGLRLQF